MLYSQVFLYIFKNYLLTTTNVGLWWSLTNTSLAATAEGAAVNVDVATMRTGTRNMTIASPPPGTPMQPPLNEGGGGGGGGENQIKKTK